MILLFYCVSPPSHCQYVAQDSLELAVCLCFPSAGVTSVQLYP